MGKIPRKKIRLRRGLAAFAVLAATSPVLFTAGSSAAPVGQGFNVTPSDMSAILRQIKIAEAHVANTTPAFLAGPDGIPGNADDRGICDALVGPGPNQVASPLVADGLRTVDGSCNNLIRGQEKFGAEGQLFPRLATPVFKDADPVPPGFGPPGPSSYTQNRGLVFDSQPRLISNLIVDQTSTNPAAVSAAGFPVRTQGNPGVAPCTDVNEVQTISGTPSADFSILFDGQATTTLAQNASAAAVRTALEALPNIGVGDVKVTGGPLPGAITVTFQGALAANNVAQLALVAGTSPITGAVVMTTTQGAAATPAVAAVSEVRTISGTATVDYTISFGAETTASLASTASATDVETALNNLTNLDGVSVTGGPMSGGTPFTITFPSALGNVQEALTTAPAVAGDPDQMTVATSTEGVTGIAAVPAVDEVQTLSGTPSAAFALKFGAQTTASLAPDATATDVQAALWLILANGNVNVTGGPLPATLTITFTGALAGTDVADLTIVPGTSPITGATLATPTEGVNNAAGCVPAHQTLFIPNVTTDVGLSPPFNGLFTIFGQFFDHGVDQTVKGGSGTVFVPLKDDDPLVAGPDHVFADDPGTTKNEAADNLPPSQRFMVLTRATNQPGPDQILGTADDIKDATNTDTPFVDQSQTYTSNPAHQVYLRDYVLNGAGKPVSTGKLIHSADGGMGTWALVKKQAAEKLGLALRDKDVLDIPMVAADFYGNFIPGPNGLAQYVTDTGLVEGILPDPITGATPVEPPANVKHFQIPFLTDIAHSAVPDKWDHDNNPATPKIDKTPDANTTAGGSLDPVAPGTYDDELLKLHFIAGDGRVNENIALTAVHQIFHSEHDRLVDDMKHTLIGTGDVNVLNQWLTTPIVAVPTTPADIDALVNDLAAWNGKRVFQAARFVTEMEYQHLVFEEFARKVQPLINPFAPFAFTQTDANPAVKAEFAHAVYRFGHSMLTETISRKNEVGSPLSPDGTLNNDIPLLDGFLNPAAYTDGGAAGNLTSQQAAGGILMGMSDQTGNEIDEFVTDTLRNNLLGLPLDLPTINLTRARSEGIPPLNEFRRQLFAATQDSQLTPYTDWIDFGLHLKHPESLINFVAAYGRHPTITSETTIAGKREAARKIVDPAVGDVPPTDAADFMNSTGAWASNPTGLNDVDLWVGGLAERTNLFGGLLGSTFNYVFENQLTQLQNSDRFYYLGRTPGMNLRSQLEGNSFAELVMRNTNASSLKADPFATADCKFQLGSNPGIAGPIGSNVNLVADDPKSQCDESALLIRMADGTIRYRTTNTVDPPGINGQSVYNGTAGVDRIFGGVDNDTFYGNEGNDIIEGSDGADVVLGGAGNDRITDSAGDDVLKGGPGNDAIEAGPGLDVITAGDGKDFTNGGANINATFAGEGDDFIILGQGEDLGIGDGGDDWLEGGDQPDGMIGDSSSLFFTDPNKPGNDIFIGQGGDDDYDMEGGDDIGVTGPGIEKTAGAAGYDWSTGVTDPQPQNADLALKILPADNIVAIDVRDKFNEVEALSGGKFDDILKGDSIVPTNVAGAGFIGCDALDQAGLDRISGLDALVPPLTTPSGPIIANSATQNCPLQGPVWGDGNILLGGAGSDLITGRGANDIIDGDKYLNVRLSVRTNPNDPSTEIGTTDLMETTATTGSFGPNTAGKTLQQAVFAGNVDPGNIVAVREILTPTTGLGVDTAVFSDVRSNYTITPNVDGSITVAHLGGTGADGTDTLWNVELLTFSDGTIGAGGAGGAGSTGPTTGAPSITGTPQVGLTLTAANGSLVDPDGIQLVSFAWEQETAPGSGVWTQVGTGLSFTPGPAQATHALRVVAQVLDNVGALTSGLTSTPTVPVADAVVAAANNAPTGEPFILDRAGLPLVGRPKVNDPLGVDTSTIADIDGMIGVVLHFQWQRSGGGAFSDIPGATGQTFTPTAANLGDLLQVRVFFTDQLGSFESLTSAPTRDVRPARTKVAPLVLGQAAVPGTINAAGIATGGVTVTLTAPATTTVVRVRILGGPGKRAAARTSGTAKTVLATVFINVKPGTTKLKLRHTAIMRALKRGGVFWVEMTPGTSRTNLGTSTVRRINVHRAPTGK